jgi:hypothetical protein
LPWLFSVPSVALVVVSASGGRVTLLPRSVNPRYREGGPQNGTGRSLQCARPGCGGDRGS